MEKPYILHMFTTEKNLSPFDVNMALDAGWLAAIPYEPLAKLVAPQGAQSNNSR